VLGPEAM